MPRVASVSGTCRLTTSEQASSSSSDSRSIPWRLVELGVEDGVESDDSHAEDAGTHGDGAADPTHADQAQRHAANRSDQRPVPAPLVNHAIVGDDPSRQRQEQCQGLLGDALLVGPGRDRHGDLVRGRGRRRRSDRIRRPSARSRASFGASSNRSGVIRSPPAIRASMLAR